MTDSLSARVACYQWHHSIDLGSDVVTPGNKSLDLCKEESELIFGRIDLSGRSVLDIGSWNGFFSFEAKRRGASRVLATDSYCWQNTAIRGKETFDLAREALGIEVETKEIDVSEMTPELLGTFDVVLFLGVFYHRYNPIDALARAARLTSHVLVVETLLDLRKIDRPAMAFYPGSEILSDSTTWWAPNERCMEGLLRGHGFAEIEVSAHPVETTRAVFHAWRSTELRRSSIAEQSRLKPAILDRRSKIVRELRRPFRRWTG